MFPVRRKKSLPTWKHTLSRATEDRAAVPVCPQITDTKLQQSFTKLLTNSRKLHRNKFFMYTFSPAARPVIFILRFYVQQLELDTKTSTHKLSCGTNTDRDTFRLWSAEAPTMISWRRRRTLLHESIPTYSCCFKIIV